jgi:hypothetical protein
MIADESVDCVAPPFLVNSNLSVLTFQHLGRNGTIIFGQFNLYALWAFVSAFAEN